MLTHALPSTSPTGHIFPAILGKLQQAIGPSSTVWFNVFHAVPGRFSLSELPSSPPNTPGPAVGGDDYFTTTVFDSAVLVHDYQTPPLTRTTSTPHLGPPQITTPLTPRPIVPPESVHVSIVERYIPPTTSHEIDALFASLARPPSPSSNSRSSSSSASSTSSSCLLLDRLVELRPQDGTLLFIYPTLNGGKTFVERYLGPILDPILRAMTIVHSLSADMATSLGTMPAVNDLYTFEQLRDRLEQLCRELSGVNDQQEEEMQEGEQKMPSAQNPALHFSASGRPPAFEVVHASRAKVKFRRNVWAADWWTRQEKPRVRAAVSKYFRAARRLPEDSELVPTRLIQDLLDGVVGKRNMNTGAMGGGNYVTPNPGSLSPALGFPTALSLPEDMAEVEGIELGVFAVRRTA